MKVASEKRQFTLKGLYDRSQMKSYAPLQLTTSASSLSLYLKQTAPYLLTRLLALIPNLVRTVGGNLQRRI